LWDFITPHIGVWIRSLIGNLKGVKELAWSNFLKKIPSPMGKKQKKGI